MKNQKLDIKIDPLDHYLNDNFPHLTREHLIRTLGYLPLWAQFSWLVYGEFDKGMLEQYRYPSPEFDANSSVNELGQHTYPGDPNMDPILSMESETEIIFFYQHAMYSVFNKETWKVITRRMD